MQLYEERLGGERVFEGRVFSVDVDTARLENGNRARREVVVHRGGVCAAPVDSDGNVYMVRQFRYPFKKVITELPAGKLEIGENPDDAIRRELHEEVGFEASALKKLAVSYPSPGFSSEELHLYLATGLTYVGQKLDSDEFLNVVKMPLDEAADMVLRGEISDGKTQTLLLMAQRCLKCKE